MGGGEFEFKNSELSHKISLWCLCSLSFLIPISTAAVTGILPSILLGLWLISRHYHRFPVLLKKSLATQLSIALFVWLALAGLIGGGGLDSVTFLKKYRELILIPIFIGFTIHMSSRERFHICLALNVGLLVTLAVSLLQIVEILPLRDGQPTLSSTLTQASLMSWGMFWMMHQFRQTRSVKWLIGALVVATYSIFLMQSTTGLLLIVVMLGLFGLQTMRWKNFVTVITIACGVIFGAYMSIDQFKVELDESIIVGIKFLKSEQLDEGQLATSPGERYEFVSNGVKLFLQKPLIGHGPGSVEQQYGELTSGTHSKRTTNLHNEYLMIGAQSGVIGIFLWIGVLWAIVTTINCNGMTERCLLQGIVVWMAVGCLVNSFLLDAREGMLFALMTAVLCVPKFKKDNDYQAFSFHSRT